MKIIVVFKTHFDIGFTDLASEVVKSYGGAMLKNVIATCEGTQSYGKGLEYVWTMPSWPLLKALENAAPDTLARAEALIERGQLVCHALPFTMHTEFAGVEELTRGMTYAEEFSKKYNRPRPVAAKMTDVPCHTWFLVSLLAKSGVKFLHLGSNAAWTPPDVPTLFWWEAPDGERVLTFYSKGAYGTELLPPKNWPFPVWLALRQTNDNRGPHTPQIIGEILDAVPENYSVQVGTLDDFYNELIKCDLSGLPVIKKDLADTWIHGVGTYPAETALIRRARKKLRAAAALNKYLSVDADAEQNAALDDFLLFAEHTWGLNVEITLGDNRFYEKKAFNAQRSSPAYKRIEKSWDEKRGLAKNGAALADNIYSAAAKELSRRVKPPKNGLTVFNPSKAPFTGSARLPLGASADLPCTNIGGQRYVRLENVPPLCAAAVTPESIKIETAQNPDALSLTNGKLTLLYDKRGQKLSVITDGKTVIENFSPLYNIIGIEKITEFLRSCTYRFHAWGINDLGRQNYPEAQSADFSPVIADAYIADNALNLRYEMPADSFTLYGAPPSFTARFAPTQDDNVNIVLSMPNKPATPFVESFNLIVEFPTLPRYRINKVGTVVDPKKDIQKDCNFTFFCVEDYVSAALADGVKAFVMPRDTSLISFGSDGVYRNEKRFKPDKKLFLNLFNTMWGTNFPQWIEGSFDFEFDITFKRKGEPFAPNNGIIFASENSEG
ncbi:MAG: hypothetical protein LBP26_03690 [Clostridiales bacterium]|jgi:hypothetical protein|nr:hypothetical protein [Clostridiales bacterium]